MDVNSLIGKAGQASHVGQSNVFGNMAQGSSILERTQYYHPPSSGGGAYGGGYHHQDYHSYGGGSKGGGKRSVALTALTLLSFLFFLHILENCIQQQQDMMNPQVVIMQARIRAHNNRRHENKRMSDATPSEVTYANSSVNSVKNFDQITEELYHYDRLPQISPTRFK